LHVLDNLRATMMWLGIVLHVSVLYMSRPSPLPWHDDQSSPLADLLVAVIHAFRMPLFFILAGFLWPRWSSGTGWLAWCATGCAAWACPLRCSGRRCSWPARCWG